ncbi:MAG: O-antigen ligase family protein [Gammaproteobacteria bacterium]|nr:O-antigen ligase family protein [Gammaproteobacteria bacterium]
MRARARRNRTLRTSVTTDERIDQAILWITLGALFIIPLIFSYFKIVAVYSELKVVTLHLAAGLIAILWLWQIVFRRINTRGRSDNQVRWDLVRWAGRNPARWALISAAVWVFAQIAANLLSPLPIISFFGGDEARSGYNLYDSLSLFILFLSVALRFRSRRSLELLAYTLIASGTIAAAYGIAQHFGWDPIGNNAGRVRVIASFGNTLNFGAYMVMTIPATMAMVYRDRGRRGILLAFIIGALALQLSGLWFSGGRGPFVAALAALGTFFIIAAALGSYRAVAKAALMLVISGIIAVVIIVLPSPQGNIGLERALSIGTSLSGASGASTDIKGGLAGRLNIWGSTLKLATRWDVPNEEPVANSILRPAFGLGQDMLVYSFPLAGKPQTRLAILDHAHNYELQVLMENGFVGLLGFIGFTGLLGIALFAMVRRFSSAGRGINPTGIVLLALLPAMVGKLVELQTGVPRVSDLAMTFALFGAAVALYELVNSQLTADARADAPSEKPASARSSLALTASNQVVLGSTLLAAVIATAVLLIIFFGWDVRRLSASVYLAGGHDDPSRDRRAQVWDEAQKQAPERESFTHALSEQYVNVAKEQRALGNENESLRLILVGRALLLEYEKRDPFEWDAQIGLSKIAAVLAEWGNLEFSQELADRSTRIVELYPSYPTLVGTAATAMTSVGLHELAIEYADRAIAVEATTQPWSKAWYAKGRALFELGRPDEAIEALITATEKQPGAEGALLAHQVLGDIYRIRGETELSEYHRQQGQGPVTFQE